MAAEPASTQPSKAASTTGSARSGAVPRGGRAACIPDRAPGPLPLCRAKASLDRKRLTPAVSPTILAARQRPAAGQGQERRCQAPDEARDLALEGADGGAQLDDPRQQVAGETGHGLGPASEGRLEGALDDRVARASAGAGSAMASSTRNQRRRCSWRVRSPTRSSRWSTSRRTSRSGPSSVATGRSGSRRTARATARASIGIALAWLAARAAAVYGATPEGVSGAWGVPGARSGRWSGPIGPLGRVAGGTRGFKVGAHPGRHDGEHV